MKRYAKKGQSLLEYTLLLATIIAVIVFVLLSDKTGIKSKVQGTYEKFGTAVSNTSSDLTSGVFK